MTPTSRADIEISWTRMGLVLLGITAFVFAGKHLTDSVKLLAGSSQSLTGQFLSESFAILVAGPLPLLLAGYFLIRQCDCFAGRICDNTSGEAADWEKTAYQIAATFAGVLIIAWVLPRMMGSVLYVILQACRAHGTIDPAIQSDNNPWIYFAFASIQIAFGVFLLWAAPWLIRWKQQEVADGQQEA